MVGGALSCDLVRRGFEVAVVEASQPPSEDDWEGFDLRVSAISRSSERIFRSLGAWQGMCARRVSPFREMHVWDSGSHGSIHFDSADIGEPLLGHIIENRVVVAALEDRLAELDGVTWYRPSRLLTLERRGRTLHLGLDSVEIEADLVVGADGAGSRVRSLAGMPCAVRDYGQRGLVATVKTALGHAETAWQRFLPTGPLAFLPLTGGYSTIVWSAPSELVEALLARDEEDFRTALADAFEGRLGTVEWVGERAAFSLRRQHAQAYVQPGIALVGDAAHTVHPLAGQGANLGLLDAACLAEMLADARTRGRTAGELAPLRRYERWRKGHNLAMQAAMDGFKGLFGSPLAPLRLARGIGLNLTDGVVPAKRMFMRLAMGLAGDLPAIARHGEATSG
jgi:2-octaprenylphenol hydroxylase